MKKNSIGLIAFLIGALSSSLSNFVKKIDKLDSCDGYYYWFKVPKNIYSDCYSAQQFVDLPFDINGNGYPDVFEIPQGNNVVAQYAFGCDDAGDFCCALGFRYWDIELTWNGRWRPKYFALPECVIYRNN